MIRAVAAATAAAWYDDNDALPVGKVLLAAIVAGMLSL